MSEVQLIWPNKELSLRAAGPADYEWIKPTDPRLSKPLAMEMLGGKDLTPQSNALIVGDGMDAIEALAASTAALAGGIRLVYIDPPFNTQTNFRQYNDTMQRSKWLSMMRDRLAALKPHLADNASVWLHLDDAEVHRARAILDEVFGEGAFVASVIWQKKMTRDSRAAFSSNHDTILVYAPSGPKTWKTSRNLLTKDEALLRNRDDDPRGPWTDAPFTAPGYRRAQQYDIATPTGAVLHPPRGRSWYATEQTFKNLVADDRIWFPKGGSGSPRIKLFASQIRGLVPFTVWGAADTGTNDDAKRHLLTMFPDIEVFDTPKPESLLERIIHISTNPGELVVDLFAGSGTTAAVAHKMHRRWVAVERNVQTVLDFTLPRLMMVVNGNEGGGVTDTVSWKGGGSFVVANVTPRFGTTNGLRDTSALKRAIEYEASTVKQPRTA